MKKEWRQESLKACADVYCLCRVHCCSVDTQTKRMLHQSDEFQHFCDCCGFLKCRPRVTYAFGCNEAYRRGGNYLYYCPLGLSFVAGSICDIYGKLVGGIVAGPFLLEEEREETLLRIQEEMGERLRQEVLETPAFDAARADALSRIVSRICDSLSEKGFFFSPQYQAGAEFALPDRAEFVPSNFYPAAGEHKLQEMICKKDREKAQQLLDNARRYVCHCNDFSESKQRALELTAMMFKAASETGIDAQEIFIKNDYLAEIQHAGTDSQLDEYLSATIRRFIDFAFEFQQAKLSNTAFKVKQYVRRHFREKISLESVAACVFLSPGYLSSLFKSETGESLFSYINRIRVEASKPLLLGTERPLVEIAQSCGFEDQSYYARVFKKFTGVSPSKFRFYKGKV